MDLDSLLARLKEIDAAIVTTGGQSHMLQGHKAEVSHWIDRMSQAQSENKVEEPVANPDELPVE